MADSNVEFVTIELNRKRVLTENMYEKDGKKFAKCFAPGGGSFLYPADKLKVNENKPDIVYFSLPKGSEMNISYRDETAENGFSSRQILIEDLKAAYLEEKQQYAESHGFYNMSVPTEWGKSFKSNDGVDLVSISIPVEFENKKEYMQFVVKADSFKPSDKEAGFSYFGYPKHKMSDGQVTDQDYEVTLKGSRRMDSGEYEGISKVVTSKELAGLVESAVKNYNFKDMFVVTTVAEKLVKSFQGKSGNDLYSISVPTHDDGMVNTTWYNIVVPEERVKLLDNGKYQLNLFRKGSDDKPFTFKATRSVKDESGNYSDVSIQLTSEEVVKCFEDSKAQYQSEAHSHSLADEQENPSVNLVRHSKGR